MAELINEGFGDYWNAKAGFSNDLDDFIDLYRYRLGNGSVFILVGMKASSKTGQLRSGWQGGKFSSGEVSHFEVLNVG